MGATRALRHYLDQGLTITEISRELGISRQTIYRWVKSGQVDREVEEVRYKPVAAGADIFSRH